MNGGRNGKGGVVVEGGGPRFDRLTSRANLGHGLYVGGSEPLIHDSRLVDNSGNGLYVAEGAGLARTPADGGAGPSFTDNVIAGNGGSPITVPGSFADEIGPENTLAPNAVGEIELLSGALQTSGVWVDHHLPYRVVERGKIHVRDPLGELVVEDGVRVFFGVGAELAVGEVGGGRLELETQRVRTVRVDADRRERVPRLTLVVDFATERACAADAPQVVGVFGRRLRVQEPLVGPEEVRRGQRVAVRPARFSAQVERVDEAVRGALPALREASPNAGS